MQSIVRFARLPLLLAAGCAVAGPPTFPASTTAMLAGPACATAGRPCQCVGPGVDPGRPPAGMRRFEVQLQNTRGTLSAVSIEGIGSVLRDESNPEGSCFYFDLRTGATYHVRYLARAENRDRGISVAFSMRELADDGNWFDVIQQRCGTSDTPCRYESVPDWTEAISSGHRFHDRCGTSRLTGMRVDGGLYDRHFTDAQLSFDMTLSHEGPRGEPGGACRDTVLPPGSTEGE